MERYRKLKVKLDDKLTDKEKADIFTFCQNGQAEIVHIDGAGVIWADSLDAENLLIETVLRGNKYKELERFPKRYAETTDLSAEGQMSLSGDKVLVTVTKDNYKEYVTLLTKKPDGYDPEPEEII